MLGQQQQRVTAYQRDTVLGRLERNLAAHQQKVLAALDRYQEMVVDELADRLAQARAGKPVDPGFLHRLPIPEDYSREYERAIDRFTTQINEQVELTDDEFNQFMRDEWEWQRRFEASTAAYVS